MINIHNPCLECQSRSFACHDKCRKYQAYAKIKHEVSKRIERNIKGNKPVFKPAVYNMHKMDK